VRAYRLSSKAEEDLIGIYSFGRDSFGKKAAQRYLTELESCFNRLAEFPSMGIRSSELGIGVRRYPLLSHTIFYQILDGETFVLRVLSARADLFREQSL
jgi:toxin ParE1/3/4